MEQSTCLFVRNWSVTLTNTSKKALIKHSDLNAISRTLSSHPKRTESGIRTWIHLICAVICLVCGFIDVYMHLVNSLWNMQLLGWISAIMFVVVDGFIIFYLKRGEPT